MLKVIKEIFIYALIIALIILICGIVFYDYLPSNKLIPTEVTASLPDNLEEELQKTLIEEDEQEVLVTYTVEKDDLDKYQKTKDYIPRKNRSVFRSN